MTNHTLQCILYLYILRNDKSHTTVYMLTSDFVNSTPFYE